MRFKETCTVSVALLSLLVATTSFAAKPAMEGANIHKASKLMGADVENMQGEDLGKIEEIVLDPQDGRIAYLVVSFGGFLGLGEKYFAVPWKAFTAKAGDDDTLILNADKERLKNAPGFDRSNWPDMADRRWGTDVHTYYKLRPYWESTEASQLRTGEAVTGTVVNVNESTQSLQLRTSDGATVEMKTPEELLKGLQAGDRVEVVIRKHDKVESAPIGSGMKEKSRN